MNNILFFGATGKLGQNWVKNLLLNKKKVVANIHKNKLTLKGNIIQKKMNLNNLNAFINYCKHKKISIIINCIGLSNVEKSENDEKLADKLNYQIPSKLCKIAEKLNIPFVHISTDMLFDGKAISKYSEKSKYNAINNYSKTKVKAEKEIKNYYKSLIIRTNFFGYSNKENMTITDKLLFEQNKGLVTSLWKDIYFTPIYIDTLIFFSNLLIEKNLSGIFNISSDEKISKYNFGKKILENLKIKHKLKANFFEKNKFVKRPKNMSLSNKKIKKLFPNFSDELKLKNQLKKFVMDYNNNNNV